MGSEVVHSSKVALAVLTLEWLHPCVSPDVTVEFTLTSKAPTASLPAALVGSLPCVGPLVCLEVALVGEGLVAAGVQAVMDTLVPRWELLVPLVG